MTANFDNNEDGCLKLTGSDANVFDSKKMGQVKCIMPTDGLFLHTTSYLMAIVPGAISVTRSSTLGDRAFPVTVSRAWNSLLNSMRNIESLQNFRLELKIIALLVVV